MAVHPSELGKVVEAYEQSFAHRGELGASVSVWWDGRELLSLGQGWCEKDRIRAWTERTLVPVYSATKVPSAATLLLALDRSGLAETSLVREVWPGFPQPDATFAQMMSHQCGLPALDMRAEVFDHAAVVEAIEAQRPFWPLGEGHGYHPRTFGAMLDEPVRRLTGRTLGDYWNHEIAGSLGLDFWIGLPEREHGRVARLYPGKAEPGASPDAFYDQFNQPDSLTRRAFASPRGLQSVMEMNDPKAWSGGFPAMGGVGSAHALAKFYQAVMGRIESPLTEQVRAALGARQSMGEDRILHRRTAFTCGAQMDPMDGFGTKERMFYGPSVRAFGHPGAGGSHAFCDPDSGISFAYTMNQMELSVMPGERCAVLVRALFSEHGMHGS